MRECQFECVRLVMLGLQCQVVDCVSCATDETVDNIAGWRAILRQQCTSVAQPSLSLCTNSSVFITSQ